MTIQVDEQTAQILERQATAAGLSIAEYVRTLVPAPNTFDRPSWDELERQIIAFSSASPPLPADFSRLDIYRVA